ncbi:hypothetical protein HY501_02645 [Candidatus Woesearchaeota archaeon]|nr:hypothetical protein [Candidatus Woesearchaeota archaeon]
MATIQVREDSLLLHGVYVATQAGLSIDSLLQGCTEIGTAGFFPWSIPDHDNIDGRKALVPTPSGFMDVVVTYSRTPIFDDRFYDLSSNPPLEGYTTLHVAALGEDHERVGDVVNRIVSVFPQVVDLPIRQRVEHDMAVVGKKALRIFHQQEPYLTRYRVLSSMLTNPSRLPQKMVQIGVVPNIVKGAYHGRELPFDRTTQVYLVEQCDGLLGSDNVKLALLHLAGNVTPMVYGVLLMSKGEFCDNCTPSVCESVRSYAGLVLQPDLIRYGGTELIAMPNSRLGHVLSMDSAPLASDFRKIQERINGFREFTNHPPDHIKQIQRLAGRVYDACRVDEGLH